MTCPGQTLLKTNEIEERLEENLAAADLELTDRDLAEIESSAGQVQIQGARYPEHLERLIDR